MTTLDPLDDECAWCGDHGANLPCDGWGPHRGERLAFCSADCVVSFATLWPREPTPEEMAASAEETAARHVESAQGDPFVLDRDKTGAWQHCLLCGEPTSPEFLIPVERGAGCVGCTLVGIGDPDTAEDLRDRLVIDLESWALNLRTHADGVSREVRRS